MSACEVCWGDAYARARMLGGTQVEHYRALLAERAADHPSDEVPRCQHVSPSPWGPTQCALPDGHAERHAYDPAEDSP